RMQRPLPAMPVAIFGPGDSRHPFGGAEVRAHGHVEVAVAVEVAKVGERLVVEAACQERDGLPRRAIAPHVPVPPLVTDHDVVVAVAVNVADGAALLLA